MVFSIEISPKCVNNGIMKKFVCVLILFCFASPAFSAIEAPKWSEWCPNQYLNAEYMKDNTLPKWADYLLAISIVGYPYFIYDLKKYQKIQNNNYWVDRREKFNKRMEECKNITDPNELMYRYLTERQIQDDNDNNLRLNNIEARQRALATQQNWQYVQNSSRINQLNNYNNFNR